MSSPILQLSGICKRFPGVVALDDVSLSVDRGEVVALIGENGAGKSTLMKVLGGVHRPDGGEVRIDGQPQTIRDVADAVKLGIGFVHQELNVLPNLDVGGNMFLGREPLWAGPLRLIDRDRIRRDSEPHLRRLGLDVSPTTPVSRLSLAQQQMVEIAKALSQNARILILDEPTAALDVETEARVMAGLENLMKGRTTFVIAHRLSTVRRADLVLVLDQGQIVESGSFAELVQRGGHFARLYRTQFALEGDRAASS